MTIRPATPLDIPVISKLANEIWWPTYQSFIPAGQINFMLDKMYSEDALQQQMEAEGISFLIAERDALPVAFAGFSEINAIEQVHKLHKLYLLPSEQGKGSGKALIYYIIEMVKSQGGKILELNVNRSNPAYGFYKKLGFSVYQTVDIPYYEFILNDYVMRKNL